MQLPNKLYSYKESTLALLPMVIMEIKNGNTSVINIFRKINQKIDEPTDFLSVMDALYALNIIEMDDEGEITLCL